MAQPYPKEDHLVGNFAPIRMECNIDDLIIDVVITRKIMPKIIIYFFIISQKSFQY